MISIELYCGRYYNTFKVLIYTKHKVIHLKIPSRTLSMGKVLNHFIVL